MRCEIYRAELLDASEELATYEIECSTGTYIRTLIETLADAYCSALRRTADRTLRTRLDAGEEISALISSPS